MKVGEIIETTRLKLRPWRMSDVPSLTRLYTDDVIMRYMRPGKGLPRTEAESRAKANIVNYTQQWQRHGFGVWAVEEPGDKRLIGHCGLNIIEPVNTVEVLYLLNKTMWGRGYASELAGAALDFGFRQQGLDRIIGLTHPDNKASQRVLSKSGLSFQRVSNELWDTQLAWFEAGREDWLQRSPALPETQAVISPQSP